MIKDKIKLIKCPKCGYEYHPAEIFFPDDILGKPNQIIRNENNEIEFITGDNPELTNQFVCYNCETMLEIEAKVSYKCNVNSMYDFTEDYSSPILENNNLELEETNLF